MNGGGEAETDIEFKQYKTYEASEFVMDKYNLFPTLDITDNVNLLCPSNHYHPVDGNIILPKRTCGCGKSTEINTNLVHLPSCQMIKYKSLPPTPTLDIESCSSNKVNRIKVCACGNEIHS